jgi:hypothetical protein
MSENANKYDLSVSLKIYFMHNISKRDFIISNLNLYGQLFDWTRSRIFIFIGTIRHFIAATRRHSLVTIQSTTEFLDMSFVEFYHHR